MTGIHREIYGQGRPLVMLHGWAMHSGIWREFARHLARHRQVICLDLPGHGRSAELGTFDLPTIAAALLNAIPVNRFSVLGWSLGATVALDMAARCPDRVQSLFLLSGNPKFVKNADWPGVRPEVLDGFVSQLSEDTQLTLQRFLGLQVQGLPESRALLHKLRLAVHECDAPASDALQGGLHILKNSDLRKSVVGLRCPITVMQGDKDTLIPAQTGRAIKTLNPRVALHVLTNAGHVPFLSHSQQLCDIVAAAE
ncbi:Pimeloyl-[acyl-carrier protein] methyl ester esterase BioH (EC 3.1.1.85) [Methylomonas albis]|uniref:Pimeloyl-[acyl-carrier protein] methyl ester esterase n=1 Tax=Methylomonas albis TaxID=1854563 RepID=A0ABR9D277_9GAMM|nr:pimeloyl-ACP methyl ester esterase BioH [Methylomonas albis]MBD9356936.1 pimeloyl-ACP methyl ester esterase BioH [Methylomonas albis]CAD6880125.1 Pimeloyl-[acyl-carrier protein] methyl ester esterase BioH (EC 3.1.1.85) [Methylomonas albis]